jgi:hypothetical protein
MIRNRRKAAWVSLIGICGVAAVFESCSSVRENGDFNGRSPSSIRDSVDGSKFDQTLSSLGLQSYRANLHSHHFMKYVPPKKDRAKGEVLTEGPCQVSGSFPEDDGKPCRDNAEGENVYAGPESPRDRLEYFKNACSYAREQGDLDILFITPHTKNGVPESDTSTLAENLTARHKILKDLNKSYDGKFLCALGQEASSISSGNHMGILGHFGQDQASIEPFFFPTGSFDQLYAQVKKRSQSGEKVILALNHPDAGSDLFWGELKPGSVPKEALNDYGLDDIAPLSCKVKQPDGPNCSTSTQLGDTASNHLTYPILKSTFANIREASGDAIRLIEMIPPGNAADNSTASFRPVHHRLAEDGSVTNEMSKLNRGLYNYVFYLAMGLRVGPLADQDNHHANWGTATSSRTGVLASNLNENEIFQALHERRTFASEDKNAKTVLFAKSPSSRTGTAPTLMGGELKTTDNTVRISVGYQDFDSDDFEAKVRLYYYHSDDAPNFSDRKNATQVFQLVTFGANGAKLPKPEHEPYSQIPSDRDSIRIQSGQVAEIVLPVARGTQYVFAEITQTNDNDKIYSAPIWISR